VKAGAARAFTVAVTRVKLPPVGEPTPTTPAAGQGQLRCEAREPQADGPRYRRCTFSLVNNARGRQLVVAVTVGYGGAIKTMRPPSRVG
jgi:hypothetical protein